MSSQDKIQLTVQSRLPGKSQSRALRRDRLVPAVVYGPKLDSVGMSLPELDVQRYGGHEHENTIFTLKSDDSKLNNIQVLKKAVTRDPVSRRPIHIDFYALDMTQLVKVNVELKFEGKPEGVRDGGVFNTIRRDLEVECLPTEIPDSFSVDISDMKINDNLHVSDITLPDNVKLITATDLTICSIAEVKEEAAPVVAAPVEGEAAEGEAPAAGGEAAPAGDAKAEGDKKE